jgi:WD40 repeat protein
VTMTTRNPFKIIRGELKKRDMRRERRLLQREETMREDLERYLMEMEDRSAWVTYQLNNVNYVRLKKKEIVAKIARKEKEKEEREHHESMRENGLSFFKGAIKDYKKWQNSGAKHLEFAGHEGSVSSCKLSKCNGYLFSCSEDKTAMLWDLDSGQCMKTYVGHTKILNDCDIHINFERYTRNLSLLTCSGDGTLRLWNGIDTNAQVVIKGHSQAVYRCSFSPNGRAIVSCSEDKTIRTWMYPEGYLLYVFTGHMSPVTTVRYSPTGRFLISGSDYGERKILVWNAKMPVLNDPKQFPHFIYWTPAGLIRKILINQGVPKPAFWLQKNQMSALSDDRMLEFWPGEVDDPSVEDFPSDSESDSDSGSEGDDDDEGDGDGSVKVPGEEGSAKLSEGGSSKKGRKKRKKRKKGDGPIDEFIKHDVRKLNGVALSAIVVNSSGDQVEASEYNPGGVVYVCLQVRSCFASALHDVFLCCI